MTDVLANLWPEEPAPDRTPDPGPLVPTDPKVLPLASHAGDARTWSQICDAKKERRQVTGEFPLWPWDNLQALMGPFLPGHLGLVAARPGNGKTTVLLNLVAELHAAGHRVLYLCTETSAADLRSTWAAMQCGFNVAAVMEGDWAHATPILQAAEAQAHFEEALEWQATASSRVQFVDLPTLNRRHLRHALLAPEHEVATLRPLIMLDHIHRWQARDPENATAELSQVVRELKGFTARTRVTMLFACQLNRPPKDGNPMSEFLCPPMSALKQTGALEEEANWVLLLHRMQRAGVTASDFKAVKYGEKQVRDLIEERLLCLTVGKHRNRPKSVGAMARLCVEDGVLTQWTGASL